MGVDADELDRGQRLQARHGLGGGARRQPEPELGVLLAGADEFVGVRLHARGDPDEHRRARAGPGGVATGEALQAVDLVEGVDDDAAHPGIESAHQLRLGLVVAVQHQARRGHAGGQGHVQLPARGDVEPHALLVGQARHGRAQKGLGGIGDAVPPGGHRLAAARPQVILVVDEQRRPEPVGQLEEVHASYRQVAVGTGPRRQRQQATVDRGFRRRGNREVRRAGIAHAGTGQRVVDSPGHRRRLLPARTAPGPRKWRMVTRGHPLGPARRRDDRPRWQHHSLRLPTLRRRCKDCRRTIRSHGESGSVGGHAGPDRLTATRVPRYIESGACTPRMSRPMAKPMRAASTSHSRA